MARMPNAHMLRPVLELTLSFALLVPAVSHSQPLDSDQRAQEGGSEAGASVAQDSGVELHADAQAAHSNAPPRAAGAHWLE